MAKRPVYTAIEVKPWVKRTDIEFDFNSGTSVAQKKKNVVALHEAFLKRFNNVTEPLEVSTKGEIDTGKRLSAFNLKLDGIPVENHFQAGKKFEKAGPFTDLLSTTPWEAKKDERLRSSGALVAFEKDGVTYPLRPTTAFYDWIYLNAVKQNTDLAEAILAYDSFTDIEFNPDRSLNCQAEACAMFVGLSKAGMLDEALESFEKFVEILF